MAKIFTGKVISAKTSKTATVLVERKFRHPLYKKVIIQHKKFKVHYEDVKIKQDDVVKIRETRPISKDKHFVIISKQESK